MGLRDRINAFRTARDVRVELAEFVDDPADTGARGRLEGLRGPGAVFLVGAAILTVSACGTGQARPATAPLVVESTNSTRSNGVMPPSVYCVPADTTPFTLGAATYWREVQVDEQGPDGPDGDWAQYRPCPEGRVLAESPTQSG